MSSAPDVRQVRSALVLSIGLSMVGMIGCRDGVAEIGLHVSPPSPPATTGDARQDAFGALMQATQEAQLSMPYGVLLASMDLVASTMLVFGSFMLFSRSKNTIWWVRNATIANALHIVLETTNRLVHLRSTTHKLTPAMRGWLAASSPGTPVDANVLEGSLAPIAVVFVLLALVRLGIEALLYYRVGSEPVRGFLGSASAD